MLTLRRSKRAVIFECFEASPQTAAVIAAKGALTRRFPAHAVSVPLKVFYDRKFQHELADKLSKLDVEEIQEMMPQSQKAGKKMGEIRDTTSPSLVTEMLMAILASLGEPIVCQQIQKRTRDDVLWDDCLSPWRRSALWLAIRVTLQTTLTNALGSEEGKSEYKNFMVFLITGIASQASAAELPDDLCHVIVAKVARRASKIGPKILGFVQDRALSVCRFVNSNQKSIWKAVCDKDSKRPTTVDGSNLERDTCLTLDTSRRFLDAILVNDQGMHGTQSSFEPNCYPWLGLHRELPSLDGLSSVKEENVYVLAEFEAWVSDCLPTWRQQRLAALDSETCMELAGLATKYRDAALQLYPEAPEQVSTMILVIAELWQTLDMLASSQMPLLSDFPPGVAPNLFGPLLLSKQTQMQRLREVEIHIATRQRQAKPNNPSIFSDPAKNSFAVQFYASSTHHQALRARIEGDATVEQSQKEAEWRASSDKFEQLKQDAKRRSCEKTNDEYGTLCHDEYKCQKCLINRQAEAMTIEIYEWPLPDDESSCISAVVELDCPTDLAAWRNLTWMLIHDLGRHAKVAGDSPSAKLSTYAGLHTYARQKQSRLTLASITKPFAKAHYHLLKLPVTLASCYARNALHYRLFDSVQLCWIYDQVKDPDIHAHCITPLPQGPYSNLQYAVDSVNHSQNEVIADQESCSKDLSLLEFLSFGSLRADGERVQWQNIKRELIASNLSLNTEAVCTLITHAAWQAGSSGDSTFRNSHLDLRDPSFCEELLTNVAKVLVSISANWKSDNAMFLLIVIVLRVLSLSSDTNVNSVALDLLQKMRVVTGQWTEILGSILHNAVESTQILKVQQRLLKAAILCKMTFDVDAQHICRVMNNSDDLKTWTKSSMHVRDNLPGKEKMLSIDLRRLLLRDRKVSHALHRDVRLLIIKHKCKGLDLAIEQQWSDFQPQPTAWSTFKYPNERWVHTRTASSADRRSQQVHYNILEGELLVDGSPLGRLPTDYIRNPLYLRLFGAQILHVFSSDMDGMLFMSAREVNGYLVHFGKRGGNFVIKVRKGSQILELVPQDTFIHDLPSAFIERYFHWLNIARQEIELRPLNQAWQSSLDNWRLLYQSGSTSTLVRKDRRLIDIRSGTCANIQGIFGALETIENVHVTLSDSGCLEVALPRYDLRFFLNHDGELECREFCKVVDPDQSVGTLIGLESRLVLSGVQKLARKHDRILLIPEGEVASSRREPHVEVSISVQGPRIRLFQYPIDATLRRLHGGGDMYGLIYKAYLHAITSHTLPDPLTARTGTEEALVYLRHRSLGFSKPPDQKMINLLTRISILTPHREYYPNHLKVMQRVKWDRTLSMMIQHDDFLPLAEQIITSGNDYIVFYPESQPAESLYKGRDFDLLERGMIRNSGFRSSYFGGDISTRNHDSEYKARDCRADTTRGHRSFEIASLVRDWPKKFEVSDNLERDLRNLGMVLGVGSKYDPSRPLSELLNVHLPSSWAPLQQLCRETSSKLDTYRLMFLFSVIAYGREVRSLTTLRTLLAFAFVSELRKIPVPSSYSYFELSRGTELDEEALRRAIMNNTSLYNGPGRKKRKAQWNAEKRAHEVKSKEQAEAVLQHYKGQWPSSDPAITPGTLSMSAHLDWSTASREISNLFYLWIANEKYRNYLSQTQPILNENCGEYCLPRYDSKDWHLFEKLLVTDQHHVIPSLADLMLEVSPTIFSKSDVLKIERDSKSIGKNDKLEKLIAAIRADKGGHNHHSIRTQYRDDLLASYDAFGEYKEQITPAQLPYTLTDTLIHRMTCESEVLEALKCIHDGLRAKSPASTLLEFGGLWPRFTIRSLLATLSSRSSNPPSEPWRQCLLALGESITTLQRARRLVLAGERNNVPSFCAEIENEGHQGWNTSQWPDWLLIEIDGDFLIRPMQARVALEMIQPSSSENSLVQLNMGMCPPFPIVSTWADVNQGRVNHPLSCLSSLSQSLTVIGCQESLC